MECTMLAVKLNSKLKLKATITVPNTAGAAAAVNSTNKKVIFKNCAPFTNCINKIHNTQSMTLKILI